MAYDPYKEMVKAFKKAKQQRIENEKQQEREKRLEEIKKKREQRRRRWRGLTAQAVASAIVFAALWWAVAGLFNSGAAYLFVGLLAVGSWFSSRTSGIGIPFALSLFAALLLLTEHALPTVVTDAFAPFVAVITNVLGISAGSIAEVNALSFSILAMAAILVYWALSIRLGTTRNMKPTTVAKRMETKAENLAETYLTFGRVLVIFGVSVVAITVQQFSQVSAEIVGYLANAPLAASNFLTGITGYLALGGSSPVWVPEFLRSISAEGFLVLVVLALVVAYGLREEVDS